MDDPEPDNATAQAAPGAPRSFVQAVRDDPRAIASALVAVAASLAAIALAAVALQRGAVSQAQADVTAAAGPSASAPAAVVAAASMPAAASPTSSPAAASSAASSAAPASLPAPPHDAAPPPESASRPASASVPTPLPALAAASAAAEPAAAPDFSFGIDVNKDGLPDALEKFVKTTVLGSRARTAARQYYRLALPLATRAQAGEALSKAEKLAYLRASECYLLSAAADGLAHPPDLNARVLFMGGAASERMTALFAAVATQDYGVTGQLKAACR